MDRERERENENLLWNADIYAHTEEGKERERNKKPKIWVEEEIEQKTTTKTTHIQWE